jgi:hypothetical protein
VKKGKTVLTPDVLSTTLGSILEGKQFDRKPISDFIQADRGTQEQVIAGLANSQPSQSMTKLLESSLFSLQSRVVLNAVVPDQITAAAHWWGYEVSIPEAVMEQIGHTPDILASVTALLTPALIGPLVVVLGIVAGYIAAEFVAIRTADRGKGVKLTATWLVPVLLIPSAL